MITTPQQAVATVEGNPRLARGSDERFTGYGAMGVPFSGGHYLVLRDMLASSVGTAYRSIWHRDPQGRWTIFTTAAPALSCPRYFGSAGRRGAGPGYRADLAGRLDRRGHHGDLSLVAAKARFDTGHDGDDGDGRSHAAMGLGKQRGARLDGSDGQCSPAVRADPAAGTHSQRPGIQGRPGSSVASHRRGRRGGRHRSRQPGSVGGTGSSRRLLAPSTWTVLRWPGPLHGVGSGRRDASTRPQDVR